MHKEDLQEIVDLSDMLTTDIESFIGEFNDELTRSRLTEIMRMYFVRVRAITRLPIDINKIGLCNISKIAPTIGSDFGLPTDRYENEIRANAYTQSAFRDISRIIEDNQVSS